MNFRLNFVFLNSRGFFFEMGSVEEILVGLDDIKAFDSRLLEYAEKCELHNMFAKKVKLPFCCRLIMKHFERNKYRDPIGAERWIKKKALQFKDARELFRDEVPLLSFDVKL
jgi:hypothetical protein